MSQLTSYEWVSLFVRAPEQLSHEEAWSTWVLWAMERHRSDTGAPPMRSEQYARYIASEVVKVDPRCGRWGGEFGETWRTIGLGVLKALIGPRSPPPSELRLASEHRPRLRRWGLMRCSSRDASDL